MKTLDIEQIKKREPIFGSWYIKEKLDEGSTGCVYAIERDDTSVFARSAVKVISIPKDESEIDELRQKGMSEEEIEVHFACVKDEILKEISMMLKLKGSSHVVNYEDHIIHKRDKHIGWVILIKVEYLYPLLKKARIYDGEDFGYIETVKLGISLCRALETCEAYNIVHRDIKIENVFYTEEGRYKLGDFGIAYIDDKKVSSLINREGTLDYMAPEVYNKQPWDKRVDIYSVGILMYMLLNNGRAPFMPVYPKHFCLSDRDVAVVQRMSNEPMYLPSKGTKIIKKIVMKACAFDPNDRYQSAREMRDDLEVVYKIHSAHNKKAAAFAQLRKHIAVLGTILISEKNCD